MKKGKNTELVKFMLDLPVRLDLPLEQKKEIIAKLLEKSPELGAFVQEKTKGIPASAFNSSLSGLEVLCWFMKYEKEFTAKKIANELNRSKNTINATLGKARKKFRGKLNLSSGIIIPFNAFYERKFSVLESLVAYLIKTCEMKISQIAKMIGKKPSTIKTVWYRWQKKR